MTTAFDRGWAGLAGLRATFGLSPSLALGAAGWTTLRALSGAGQALDDLLLPAPPPVEAPLLLIGLPRTGTTFLHRSLVALGAGRGTTLWRMVYPSAAVQRVLRPVLPLLERVSPARHHSTTAHETGLLEVETEDASGLFRDVSGFLAYAFLLAWADEDLAQAADPTGDPDAALDALEALWARTARDHPGERVIGKAPSAALLVRPALARWPGARFVYTVRDPTEAIPSALSLVEGALDARFDLTRADPARRERHRARLVDALVQLLNRFADDWNQPGFPREAVHVLRSDALVRAPGPTLRGVLDHAGIPVDAAMGAAIDRVAARQREYRSSHLYDASRFGLDAGALRAACAPWMETFLPG